jgi:hypothetical protein
MVEFRSVGRPLDENVKEVDFEDAKVLRGAERREVVAMSIGRKLERRVEGNRAAIRVEIVVRSILLRCGGVRREGMKRVAFEKSVGVRDQVLKLAECNETRVLSLKNEKGSEM